MLGRFQETLRIWRLAMAGERFDFDGRVLAGRGGGRAGARGSRGRCGAAGNAAPAAIRRSAEYGEAWTGDPMPIRATTGTPRPACTGSGRASSASVPFVVRMQDGWVADTRAEALRVIGPHYARMVDFYARSDMGRDVRARGPRRLHAGRHRRRVHRAAARNCTRTRASTTSSSAAASRPARRWRPRASRSRASARRSSRRSTPGTRRPTTRRSHACRPDLGLTP